MSSIGVPNRIERVGGLDAAGWADLARVLLAAAVLVALLITLTPFAVTFSGNIDSGALVNQLGYSGLAAAVIAGHLVFTERYVLASLCRPTWLLMFAWLAASAFWAAEPDNALRSALFTLLAMLSVTGVLCFPKDPRAFRIALLLAVLGALLLSYFGVLALPGLAIDDGSDEGGVHAGLWRGVYSHKNVAGAVIGSLFFCGVYLWRCGHRLTGIAIALLSVVFVLKTGSKTATLLLPMVAGIVVVLRLFAGRTLLALGILATLIAMGLLTLGTVLSPALNDILQAIAPDTTFTGRMDLWRFALEVFQGHEWTGFGLNGFWQTPAVGDTERNFELSWDPRGSPNAHNGYLDIAISMGWPGLALAVLVLVIMPLVDYVRTGRDLESRRLADLFLMILTYLLLNAFLESFLFERANPIWMLVWFAVAGLRLLSANRVRPT
ncbi:O-antigen ligase family protein [Aurantimonas sp. MSK8Z-1]|uniref:O-antigen ligase family protein n=1 Tax=Mangrovibrevibacter kandeliae TaxID=2968473 RepID=UPI00211870CC|nr:O-antigen ligase [Aurantimonas sp. MSK8Z-1]MCW4116420.1 O-antigen ligase family protein [Aurantimonas sp. MSK8Z-1]